MAGEWWYERYVEAQRLAKRPVTPVTATCCPMRASLNQKIVLTRSQPNEMDRTGEPSFICDNLDGIDTVWILQDR
jgi:hypothetical protein